MAFMSSANTAEFGLQVLRIYAPEEERGRIATAPNVAIAWSIPAGEFRSVRKPQRPRVRAVGRWGSAGLPELINRVRSKACCGACTIKLAPKIVQAGAGRSGARSSTLRGRDLRRGSPTFGRSVGEILSEQNERSGGGRSSWLVVGGGFEQAEFAYKCSEYYAPEEERGVIWNDPTLAIAWPIPADAVPILSGKDSRYPRLQEMPVEDLPVYRNSDG